MVDGGDVGFVPWVNGSKAGHGPCSPCLWLYPSHPNVLQLHAELPGFLGQHEHTRYWQGLQKSLFIAFKDGLIFYFFSNLLVCALLRGWELCSFHPCAELSSPPFQLTWPTSDRFFKISSSKTGRKK